MEITGEMLIGGSVVRGSNGTLRAVNPVLGVEIEPTFGGGGQHEVEQACRLAEQAFDNYRETSAQDRARFLRMIGKGVLELGDALIERASLESGLPIARLQGERARTVGQLELFASIIEDGRWIDATLDSALPERKPVPRVDLRLRNIAIGPVAIFGASNFPLAFSVAGGDTASALAAGCPVVVKAHPLHLGTSEMVGRVIQAAVSACGLHEGVFSLLIGKCNSIGADIVGHPAIKAVGFTGSRQGGLALKKIADLRSEPIPVYAEMSSVNPVFVLPGALSRGAENLAQGFVDSMTLGVGQFCTNPGVLNAIEGQDFDRFRRTAMERISGKKSAPMLSAGIHSAYVSGVERLKGDAGVSTVAEGTAGTGACEGNAALFSTEARRVIANPKFLDEVFGPSSIMVACETPQQLCELAEAMSGELTASIFLDETDVELARQLVPILERKVGRLVFNGYPTGVEVSYAMMHGGPFPATSDSRFTSVGANAIKRFVRPVCYQAMPPELMPESLQDSNPLGIWRLRDGALSMT